MKRVLRHGYTTGACAAAAAKGAALMLARQERVDGVSIDLPAGMPATFPLYGQEFGPESASCYVIKDAGDDPDVTNGAEVHALVRVMSSPPPFQGEGRGEDGGSSGIIITGGVGIGKATKPGLAVAPGEWAINPVPRRMIAEAVLSVFPELIIQDSKFEISVVISIPDGEERARKTLNARLGIVGGLSILGTTGIVRPISAKAWTDTIDAALDVARACGCTTVVLSTGRSSEMAAEQFLATHRPGHEAGAAPFNTDREQDLRLNGGGAMPLPEEAYIMMGDHVAYALDSCQRHGFLQPLIACQFAKLLKIACGHEQTHVSSSLLDLRQLADWCSQTPRLLKLAPMVLQANTARQVLEESANDQALIAMVCGKAREAAELMAAGLEVGVLLAGYGGEVLYCSAAGWQA
jgi:cobalt-precorrin-5B (C1)-methyltransferase